MKNRIVEMIQVHSNDLFDHPDNPRSHPPDQRAAVGYLLDTIGIADVLLAYRSERYGQLTCLNGHLRKNSFPGTWPVVILDLTDQEADLLLATHDPTAKMAGVIADVMRSLADRLDLTDTPLRALIEQQRAEADLADLMAQVAGDLVKTEGGGSDGRGAGLASGRVSVRPVIWIEDIMTFEEALRRTKNPCRGEAVIDVCTFYLEHHGDETG